MGRVVRRGWMRAVRAARAHVRQGCQAHGRHRQLRARPRRRRHHAHREVRRPDQDTARARLPRAQDAQPVHEKDGEDRSRVSQQHELAQANRGVRRRLAPGGSSAARRGRRRLRDGARRRGRPPDRRAHHREGNHRIALQVTRPTLPRPRRVRRGTRVQRRRRPRRRIGSGHHRDRTPGAPRVQERRAGADRARRRDETRGASRLYRNPRGGRARG